LLGLWRRTGPALAVAPRDDGRDPLEAVSRGDRVPDGEVILACAMSADERPGCAVSPFNVDA